MPKIKHFINYAKENNYKYCMKMDNDIILPPHIYDYIYENLSVLSEEIGILFPTLYTSIPSAEYFIEDFLTQNEKDIMYKIFSSFRYSDHFKTLNPVYPSPWNLEKYFDMVENMTKPHGGVFKAVHPIRWCFEATKKINDYAIEKKEQFLHTDKKPYIYVPNKTHYFMPQCYLMKVDLLEKVLDPSLAVDIYDEVTLNRLVRRENKKIAFVRNCFGIHIAHNGHHPWFLDYEIEVLNQMFPEYITC